VLSSEHKHHRFDRQMDARLDSGPALVLTHPLMRVCLAVLAPRLAGDRLTADADPGLLITAPG
jgi:hypothetical protein